MNSTISISEIVKKDIEVLSSRQLKFVKGGTSGQTGKSKPKGD